MSRWRKESQRVIQATIAANTEANRDELKKLLSDAYPFGERAYHPYKIWLDEVKRALNDRFGPKPTPVDIKNFWVDGGSSEQ